MLIKTSKGQLLVEILVAIGLCTLLIPVIYAALITSRQGRMQEEARLEAVDYLRDCQESLKSIREISWNSIPVSGTYYPSVSGSTVSLILGSQTIGGRFTRNIVLEDVQRDTSGSIVTTGGTVDPSTIKATCNVSWTTPLSSAISSVTYLTRTFGNTFNEVTTKSQFDAGTFVSTESQSAINGEVILSSVPTSSWTTPALVSTYNDSGTTNAMHVTTDGNYAYLAKAGNPSVVVVNVTVPASPTLSGSITISGNVADLMLNGNYIYAATTNNSRELSIIDITNKSSPSNTGNGNMAGNSDGISVYYSSSYAYIGRVGSAGGDKEFGIINVSTPSAPTVQSELEIGYTVNHVVVSGNYAFLGTNNGSNELYIINTTNKSSPTIAANVNLPGTAKINSLAISGNSLLVATDSNGSGAEFYVMNISNPISPSISGTYEAGLNLIDVQVVGSNAFIVRNSTTNTFSVLDISNPSSISVVSSVSLAGVATGVSVFGSYAYVSNTLDTGELQIIGGGSGSSGFVPSGTYESETFDAGSIVGFNYLTFNTSKPTATDVQLQIAVNSTGSGWNFVGPDGTSGTYFMGDGALNLNNVKGRYFRAKAYLTGDGSNTPQLQSFRINYSL
jgi:hypothetical protein